MSRLAQHLPDATAPQVPNETVPAPAREPLVVIVGSGFGGVAAARALRHERVRVLLIDRTNHYLFQPLLYQVATGVLSPADIARPIRVMFRRQPNVTVIQDNVHRVDLDHRTLHTTSGDIIHYDYLVIATGARHSYFGHGEWEPLAPGLKTLDDARRIRQRFLTAFEEAERCPDSRRVGALLTFAIVGGGPTGVELAGILPTIARRGFRRDFRRIDPATARWC